ncbi:MAG TPA: MAPEG family protein [Steroidobacteraceae bacterium]
MSALDPLLPTVAMVAVTAVVWVRLYVQRIREMRRRRIAPGQLATSRQAASTLHDTSAADNFRNLFEVPVLFYVLCLGLYATHLGGVLLLSGCWLFVALRAVHSVIQCTYNNVMHRFYVYFISTVLLFVLWAWLAVELIRQA